jgi:hypothetical protein
MRPHPERSRTRGRLVLPFLPMIVHTLSIFYMQQFEAEIVVARKQVQISGPLKNTETAYADFIKAHLSTPSTCLQSLYPSFHLAPTARVTSAHNLLPASSSLSQ